MSNAETIKDFLVSLGFELDEAGRRNSPLWSLASRPMC